VFWSKIWLFLITLVAAVGLTVALVLPRPAQRALIQAETNRLQTACSVIHILLTDDARNRVDLAQSFARTPAVMSALEAASGAERLDEARMKQVRDVGETVMKQIQGNRKPDFAMLIDQRGRVVARVRLDEADFGDVAAGRPLIDDALAGYLRDDVWAQNGTMYFVSAAPVVKQGAYAGAVVLGHQVTNQLAQTLIKPLDVDMAFHLGGDGVAGSNTIAFDHTAMLAALGRLGTDPSADCQAGRPIDVRAGAREFSAVVARLPGEAGARQAYYSVIIRRPEQVGLIGSLGAVAPGDLSFGGFPWLVVVGAFVLALVLGIGLMLFEVDRPLRRLVGDALRLGKGESDRLTEDAHSGKFGSIARSVNIHIDKLGREAKTARKDLDQLLGPAPEGSLGTIDLLATALPPVRPGGSAPVAPPPSEFRFTDAGVGSGSHAGLTPSRTPPPFRVAAPSATSIPTSMPTSIPTSIPTSMPTSIPTSMQTSVPVAPVAALQRPAAPPPPPPPPPADRFEDDILGGGAASAAASRVDPYFKQIFDQFVSTKRSCNEPIAGLVYDRFAEKLVKNREDLMSKTGCRDVRFTVYIKDGKAALKATPVKDEA
jgi:hypothetical protein